MTSLTEHPAYPQILAAYTEARDDWHRYTSMREVAEEIGMTERGYCDRRVENTQMAWASSTTTEPLTQAHYDHAYGAAR